jgi:hypothetical protein
MALAADDYLASPLRHDLSWLRKRDAAKAYPAHGNDEATDFYLDFISRWYRTKAAGQLGRTYLESWKGNEKKIHDVYLGLVSAMEAIDKEEAEKKEAGRKSENDAIEKSIEEMRGDPHIQSLIAKTWKDIEAENGFRDGNGNQRCGRCTHYMLASEGTGYCIALASILIQKLESQGYPIKLVDPHTTARVPETALCDRFKAKAASASIHAEAGAKSIVMREKPVYVDFDGTLTKGWSHIQKSGTKVKMHAVVDSEPNLPIINKIRELHRTGVEIVIWSGRWSKEVFDLSDGECAEAIAAVEAWLHKYDVPYDRVDPTEKPNYGLLLDDLTVNPNMPAGLLTMFPALHADKSTNKAGLADAEVYVKFVPDANTRSEFTDWVYGNIDEKFFLKEAYGPMRKRGTETDIHTTFLYAAPIGTYPVVVQAIQEFFLKLGDANEIKGGEFKLFELEGGTASVLMLSLESTILNEARGSLVKELGISDPMKRMPHFSLAYLKGTPTLKDLGLDGKESFLGRRIPLAYADIMLRNSEVLFSRIMAPQKDIPDLVKASLIDPAQSGPDATFWNKSRDGHGTWVLKADAIDAIKAATQEAMAALPNKPSGEYAIFLQGSLATQYYTADTDVDLLVFFEDSVDIDAINAVWEGKDKEFRCLGRPVDFRAHRNKDLFDADVLDEVDALYDVSQQEWVKKPDWVDPKEDQWDHRTKPAFNVASSIAKRWDRELGDFGRILHEYKRLISWNTAATRKSLPENPNSKEVLKRIAGMRDSIRDIAIRLWNERKGLKRRRQRAPHEAKRHGGYSNALKPILAYKYLDSWGYLGKIRAIGRVVRDGGTMELRTWVEALVHALDTGEIPELKPVKDSSFDAGINGALLDELAKAAKLAIEADPRFKDYTQSPELAQTFGQIQQEFGDARSEADLEDAWRDAEMSPNWETFRKSVKSGKK